MLCSLPIYAYIIYRLTLLVNWVMTMEDLVENCGVFLLWISKHLCAMAQTVTKPWYTILMESRYTSYTTHFIGNVVATIYTLYIMYTYHACQNKTILYLCWYIWVVCCFNRLVSSSKLVFLWDAHLSMVDMATLFSLPPYTSTLWAHLCRILLLQPIMYHRWK